MTNPDRRRDACALVSAAQSSFESSEYLNLRKQARP
jgi:hypothetical protein